MPKISQSTLLKLHAKMLKKAQMKGHPFPDDVAQEYAMRLLEGLHAKATIDQAYVDILRLRSGRKTQPGYEAKKALASLTTEKQMDHLAFIVDEREDLSQDEMLDLKRLMGRIKNPRMQTIFRLRLEGFTMLEIARSLDVTQAYIHQLIDLEIEKLTGYT